MSILGLLASVVEVEGVVLGGRRQNGVVDLASLSEDTFANNYLRRSSRGGSGVRLLCSNGGVNLWW